MSNSSIIRPDPLFQQKGLWISLHHDKKCTAKRMMESHYLIENYLWSWGPINSATEIQPLKCLKPTETTNYLVDSGNSQKARIQSPPPWFTSCMSMGGLLRPPPDLLCLTEVMITPSVQKCGLNEITSTIYYKMPVTQRSNKHYLLFFHTQCFWVFNIVGPDAPFDSGDRWDAYSSLALPSCQY